MRALVPVVLLLGLLIPVLRPGTAAAEDCPGGDFVTRATCWTKSPGDTKPITASIDGTIALDRSDEQGLAGQILSLIHI